MRSSLTELKHSHRIDMILGHVARCAQSLPNAIRETDCRRTIANLEGSSGQNMRDLAKRRRLAVISRSAPLCEVT